MSYDDKKGRGNVRREICPGKTSGGNMFRGNGWLPYRLHSSDRRADHNSQQNTVVQSLLMWTRGSLDSLPSLCWIGSNHRRRRCNYESNLLTPNLSVLIVLWVKLSDCKRKNLSQLSRWSGNWNTTWLDLTWRTILWSKPSSLAEELRVMSAHPSQSHRLVIVIWVSWLSVMLPVPNVISNPAHATR